MSGPDAMPWWEAELPAIRAELARYLARRLRLFSADHDDLIGDTLLALTRQLRERPSAYPSAWFAATEPGSEDRDYLHRLAAVILKRRIADAFRRQPGQEGSPLADLAERLPDGRIAPPDRQLLLAQIVAVTSEVLAQMTENERYLIAVASGDVRQVAALDPRDRQRLHRLRARLKEAIRTRLGTDLEGLLEPR